MCSGNGKPKMYVENGVKKCKCICSTCYSGKDCGKADGPLCKNGKMCGNGKPVRLANGKCVCKCSKFYKPKNCCTSYCPKCKNGKLCNRKEGGEPVLYIDKNGVKKCRCKCKAGWGGLSCCTQLCPVCPKSKGGSGKMCNANAGGTPKMCLKNGKNICKCVCNPGYTGPACCKKLCPVSKKNGKMCGMKERGEPIVLTVGTLYNGVKLKTPFCVCKCKAGWGGPNCDDRMCPKDKFGKECGAKKRGKPIILPNGACKCKCFAPWSGKACDNNRCPQVFQAK